MPGSKPMEFSAEEELKLRGPASHAEVARQIVCSDMPVRRWRKAHGWSRERPAVSGEAVTESGPSEEEILREQVAQLKRQVRKTDRESIGDERVLRAIEDAVRGVAPVRLPAPKQIRRPGLLEEVPHHRQAAIWSDWHYGETVKREQMNGLNEFNIAVAEARVDQLVRSMLSFKKNLPALTGLDIWALGDMASGAIHALEETNEIPAAEQYVQVGYLMAAAIERLAPHYADIACAGIVGNHPRPGKEPASKDAYNNGDWIAYHIARAATSHLENVTWEIPTGGMVVRQFAGKTFLLWHGDGVRSSMPGVPWGGIARRVNVLKDMYAAMGTRIDYVVVGHFHQRCIVPGVYMNGSLVGPNEYGIKNFGGGEAPKQLLLTFDERTSREAYVSTVSFEPTQ